jgi:hypothetical protein
MTRPNRKQDPSMFHLTGRAPLLSRRQLPRGWPPATVDLADVTWVTPFDVAALASIWSRLQEDGLHPTVVPPSDPEVCAYMVDVGLDALIRDLRGPGGGSRVEPPLVRLTHLSAPHAWDDMLGDIWPAVRAVVNDAEDARRTIEIMSELIDNATTHGHSPLGTYICAQRYTGTTSGHEPGIWVGIADAGVGIPEHLRGNPKYAKIRNDAELIRLARQPWVTGTRDARGWGLVEVFQDAAASGPSDVLIRSGRGEGMFRVRQGTRVYARYRPLTRRIAGAWVHVRIAAV